MYLFMSSLLAAVHGNRGGSLESKAVRVFPRGDLDISGGMSVLGSENLCGGDICGLHLLLGERSPVTSLPNVAMLSRQGAYAFWEESYT